MRDSTACAPDAVCPEQTAFAVDVVIGGQLPGFPSPSVRVRAGPGADCVESRFVAGRSRSVPGRVSERQNCLRVHAHLPPGKDEDWPDAAISGTRESEGEVTCEEASRRGQNARFSQRPGKCFHERDSSVPGNRDDIVLIAIPKVKGSIRDRDYSESVHACGRAPFASMIDTNAEVADRHLIKICARNASLECSGPGEAAKKSLSVRAHDRPGCDSVPGRDANSAVNMLNMARTAGVSPSPSMEEGLGADLCAA